MVGLSVLALLGVLGAQAMIARGRDYPFEGFVRVSYRVDGALPALRIAMLGDSTVAGVGVTQESDTLPAQTAQRVAQRTGRAVEVEGFGVSGAKTKEVMTQLQQRDDFAVVVVVIGSNDVTKLTPPWRFRAQTERMLDALEGPTIVGGIPLFGGATAIPRPLRDVVRWYAGVLRRAQMQVVGQHPDALFVNIAELASPRFRGVADAMSSDGFHPAAVGYGFWADALAPAIVHVVEPI